MGIIVLLHFYLLHIYYAVMSDVWCYTGDTPPSANIYSQVQFTDGTPWVCTWRANPFVILITVQPHTLFTVATRPSRPPVAVRHCRLLIATRVCWPHSPHPVRVCISTISRRPVDAKTCTICGSSVWTYMYYITFIKFCCYISTMTVTQVHKMTENAKLENTVSQKMQGWKMRDRILGKKTFWVRWRCYTTYTMGNGSGRVYPGVHVDPQAFSHLLQYSWLSFFRCNVMPASWYLLIFYPFRNSL